VNRGASAAWDLNRPRCPPSAAHFLPPPPPRLLLPDSASFAAGTLDLFVSGFSETGIPYSGAAWFCTKSTEVATAYLTKSCTATANYLSEAQFIAATNALASQTCTQSTDARCTTAALTATFGAFPQVYAAWCTGSYITIVATGHGRLGNASYNLDDIPYPPGGVDTDGTLCRTRSASVSDKLIQWRAPLTPVKLASAAYSNNNYAWGGLENQISNTAVGTFGIPIISGIGWTIQGQEIFPIFNNNGEFTPEKCEVDACQEHVGQGGGTPHLHGDPFGPNCLYWAANYTSYTMHPPLIGYAHDGYRIYGRHLSYSAEGWSGNDLDLCGGHEHGDYGYHYHTKVFNATSGAGGSNMISGLSKGVPYPATTTGPFYCFRGNITAADPYFTAITGTQSRVMAPCAGMTNYYVKSSAVVLKNAGVQSTVGLVTSTATASATATASSTATSTATRTSTSTSTASSTATSTATATNSAGAPAPPTETATASSTATATSTQTLSATATATATATRSTGAIIPTETATASSTATTSSVATKTASASATASSTATTSASVSASNTLTLVSSSASLTLSSLPATAFSNGKITSSTLATLTSSLVSAVSSSCTAYCSSVNTTITSITETSTGTVIYGTNAAGVFVGSARRLATYGALTVAYKVTGPAAIVAATATAPTAAFSEAVASSIATTFTGVTTTVGTTTTTTTTASSGLSTAAVIGIAVGCGFVGLCLIGYCIYEVFFHVRAKKEAAASRRNIAENIELRAVDPSH
jgi:hypothetical protein